MNIAIKFCGLTQKQDITAAAAAGADYVGFVFFEKSPRHVSLAAARALALDVPPEIVKVGLFVNPHDAELDAVVAHAPIDMLQLHGTESPERVSDIRARYGLPVIKAVGIGDANDVPALTTHSAVADQVLVDARAPEHSNRPGGNGVSFDWRLIADLHLPVPWMLSGGLTADNVAQAIRLTHARQVDVSSGIETAPGEKDPAKIAAFAAAVAEI